MSEVAEQQSLLMTKEDLAHDFRVTVRTIFNWEKEGKIPRRLEGWQGRDPRWLRTDINDHLINMRQKVRTEQSV